MMILDMFDGTSISEELRPVVGDVKFQIAGDISTLRLSKAGYLITSIPIQVVVPSMRVDEDRLNY